MAAWAPAGFGGVGVCGVRSRAATTKVHDVMATPEEFDPLLATLGVELRRAMVALGLPETDPGFERPKQADHGDWASTVCLRLAKPAKRNPREIAQQLVDEVTLPDGVDAIEIAGPGFLNFRFGSAADADLIARVLAEGTDYGRRTLPEGERLRVNVEFVSANPTGPLHVGAGRWAATGDAIATLIEASGHTVTREYYVNDAGNQIRTFGETIVLLALGLELGEAHYKGDYMLDLADELGELARTGGASDVPSLDGGGVEHVAGPGSEMAEDAPVAADPRVDAEVAAKVGVLGIEKMRGRIEAQLHQLGVDYDVWFSERQQLHDTGAIDRVIVHLQELGQTYVADGATFLQTEQFGDDKDRVIVRADGRPTYFAADCAYLQDKWSRADHLFYLLGADHHGYVGRLHAAAQCLQIPKESVEIRIGQLVNLLRDGEPVRMSKRAGAYITLDEVVDEVGADVTRATFLRTNLDTMVDFDLAVVTRQSMDNPVHYVQMAHARIASIIRRADEMGMEAGAAADVDVALLTGEAESNLLTAMARLPEVVASAADLRATQRLAHYAEELAGTFHRFYAECKIIGEEPALAQSRYWLAVAAKQVLANALGLLEVSAPDRM